MPLGMLGILPFAGENILWRKRESYLFAFWFLVETVILILAEKGYAPLSDSNNNGNLKIR